MKIFRQILILGVLVSVSSVVSCGAEKEEIVVVQEEEVGEPMVPNQLTQTEIDDGWILLFDGETPNGWTGYKKDSFPAGWQIIDDTMRRA